jgi:hypothetical protein
MAPDDVTVYDVQLRDLDTKLGSLGDHIPDTSRPDWREKLANLATPLDELGVRAEADRVMIAVSELYASTPESRERVRELFGRYPHVRAALWPHKAPTSKELLRPWLLGISMRDVGDDPQEMPQLLAHVCEVAVAAGVDPGSMLASIGAISSGSMRELIIEARGRLGSPAA